jgi:hypothetical protein
MLDSLGKTSFDMVPDALLSFVALFRRPSGETMLSRGEDARMSGKERWFKAASEEFDRLIETTETMKLIPWSCKPPNRKASYYNPQIRVKTKNDGTIEYRVRGTYGGNITDYIGPTAAQTADMVSIKLLLNATVSDEGAKFMSRLLFGQSHGEKGVHENPPSTKFHRHHGKNISGRGLSRTNMCWRRLARDLRSHSTGLLAQEQLFDHLASHDFHPILVSSENPCIFKQTTRDIVFCLVVDDFGVKYKDKADANYLTEVLR